MTTQARVLASGIRPTGALHIGNLFGALHPYLELVQEQPGDSYLFVADLHALTTRVDPDQLREHCRATARELLAIGFDPNRTAIYLQSSIPELGELAFILSCYTGAGEIARMHHLKSKRHELDRRGVEVNVGLSSYPILMAADILGLRANLVPVGDDQHQHLELTRNIAERLNKCHGPLFPVPEPHVVGRDRIRSLKGEGKMSKSEPQGTINLDENAKQILEKLKRSPGDTARVKRTDPGNPDICRLYTLHRHATLVAEQNRIAADCRNANISCYECKQELAVNLGGMLTTISERRREVIARGNAYLDEVLYEGGRKARMRVIETVDRVKDALGITNVKQPYSPR